MDSTLNPGEPQHFEYIDVLRGFAILGVVSVHCGGEYLIDLPWLQNWMNFGQLGVQLFFVASALTLCLSAEKRGESSVLFFYLRRFFRIAPMYYLGIVLYYAWRLYLETGALAGPQLPERYSLWRILENLFFVHGFHPANFNYIVPGGWSIATEMAFYLVFPWLFSILRRAGTRQFVLLLLGYLLCALLAQLLIIKLISPLLAEKGLIAEAYSNQGFGFLYASVLNQLPVFLVGMLGYKSLGRPVQSWELPVALALLVLSFLLQMPSSWSGSLSGMVFPLTASAAFVFLARRLSSKPLRSRLWSLVALYGRNSYSIYILHFLVVYVAFHFWGPALGRLLPSQVLAVPVCYLVTLLVTLALSQFTLHVVERPGIHAGRWLIARLRRGDGARFAHKE